MSSGPYLFRAATSDPSADSAGHDDEVHDEGPVLDVIEVEPHRLFPGKVGSSADLPQAGEAGLDQQPATHICAVKLYLARQRWAGTDERHFPGDDVPELRELVERRAAKPASDP